LRYFANIRDKGAVCYGGYPSGIGVHAEPPDSPSLNPPIGMAHEVGWVVGRVALWRVTIGKADVPGLWTLVDSEFRPA
jgi:hypothetical protein